MPARIDLPEAEILEMYRQKPDVFSIAEHFHVSDHPIRRVLRKHGAMLTLSESLKFSPKAKAAARRRCDQNRPQLTEQDAEDCRLDRAWEARNNIADVVYCRECLFAYADLTNDEKQVGKEDGHLRVAHGMSADEYWAKWPQMRLTPFDHQSGCDRNRKSASELMAMAAENYLNAEQLRDCKANPGPEWEAKNHISNNRTVCRDCGYKAGLSLYAHLRDVHKWDRKQYRAIYPKAPMRSAEYLAKLPIKLGGKPNAKKPRGRKKGEILTDTRWRIDLAADGRCKGMGDYEITARMYPRKTKPEAWNAGRDILDKYADKIRERQQQFLNMPDSERFAIVAAAESGVAQTER